jgi:hypothetical protein
VSDPSAYKEIEGRPIPGAAGYLATSNGEIVNAKTGRVLRPWIAAGRYHYVSLGASAKGAVHRYVALAFHGHPPTPDHEVAHGNGNPRDNRAQNLRWATKLENERDKTLHGTNNRPSFRCEDHPRAKLTPDAVELIRSGAHKTSDLAAMFGVSTSQVRRVARGGSWNYTAK